MGESFKNLINLTEKNPQPLYSSAGVTVERFVDAKKERPKSTEFQKAHPELYDFLTQKESIEKFNVGIIHIDGDGSISSGLASEGSNLLEIRNALKKMIYESLLDLARKMKKDPSSELGRVDYLTAYSQLVNHADIAKELGFEIFEIDMNPDMSEKEKEEWDNFIVKQKNKTYEALNNIKSIKDKEKVVGKRKAKIGLLSREALFELLEKNKA